MKKRKRSLWLSLLLTAVLTLGLLTGCGTAGAGGQENSSELHSITSDTQQSQQYTQEDESENQELILYDEEDLQDDVYAEDEEQAQTDEEYGQEAAEDSGQVQQAVDENIDENGSYTTKEDVALYIHTYGKLPSNFITKKEAQKLGWTGGSLEPFAPGKCIGGNHFGNYEGILPDGNYKECDIDTLGKKSRGAKRIIYSDDGRIYYTDDHYESFTQLY